MRIYICSRDNYTYIVFPPIARQREQRATVIEFEHFGEGSRKPLHNIELYMEKLSLISYKDGKKHGGELRLPIPFDYLQIEAIGFTIKKIEEKIVGDNYWKLHECEVILKWETFKQILEHLKIHNHELR